MKNGSLDKFRESFTNITPSEKKIESIENIRKSYKALLTAIEMNVEDNSRELSIALTSLETSLMYVVKAIILNNQNE